ncbi:hypothetical protein [Bdellovibrio sp. ArHS]|uniref:hypothetical protein n=1 Tax=Bdellovibrio sp. ArHS TaxID=1569284 RepID=UPI000ADE7BA1|nr:hypothetical protein [Bdellovibrio sp. ArHS]
MIYKILGVLIIAAAGVLAYITLQQEDVGLLGKAPEKKASECVQLTPAQQLAQMINADFQALAQAQLLPAQWNSIATVEIRMNSELAKAILGKQRPEIQRVKEGTAFLEMEFMDLPDEENPGIIIQASLFDIKSKNKIFEVGRTYTMDNLNKITPLEVPTAPTPIASPAPSANADSVAPAETDTTDGGPAQGQHTKTETVQGQSNNAQQAPAANVKSNSATPAAPAK